MVTIPMCLRFGRVLIDNASQLGKIAQSTVRMTSSVSFNQWSTKNDCIWLNRYMSSAATEEKNKTDPAQEQPPVNATESKANETDKPPDVQIAELSRELDQLKKQVKQNMDKYMRALADGENMRSRMQKEVDNARLFGIQGFCKDLVEVADVLTKATECVPKEEVSEKNPHLMNLFTGLTMTEAELRKVFKRHGLVSINPLNEMFDPNQHEALYQQEAEGKEPGTVIAVSKLGYKLHERVIRPALVGVVKAK